MLVLENVSLKSVPPTATLYGVEAKALTPMPLLASETLLSHPAAPLSPAATKMEMPSATAC